MKSTIFRIKLGSIFAIIAILLAPIKFFLEKIYLINRKPFTQGYEFYKWRRIKEFLNSKKTSLFVKNAYGLDERIIEYKWIFNELKNNKNKAKLLDAGSTINYPELINRIYKKFDITIQTLYPENYSFFDLGVSYIYEDLSKKIFKSETFDIITCISTLEHIGFDNKHYNYLNPLKSKKLNSNYLKTIENFNYILKPGGVLLLTIPFGKFQKFNTFQKFNNEMLVNMIKKFQPKKKEIKFAKYDSGIWSECKQEDIINIEKKDNLGERLNDNLASSRGIALIKLIK